MGIEIRAVAFSQQLVAIAISNQSFWTITTAIETIIYSSRCENGRLFLARIYFSLQSVTYTHIRINKIMCITHLHFIYLKSCRVRELLLFKLNQTLGLLWNECVFVGISLYLRDIRA